MIHVAEQQGCYYLMSDDEVLDVFDRDYEAYATVEWLEMLGAEELTEILLD